MRGFLLGRHHGGIAEFHGASDFSPGRGHLSQRKPQLPSLPANKDLSGSPLEELGKGILPFAEPHMRRQFQLCLAAQN